MEKIKPFIWTQTEGFEEGVPMDCLNVGEIRVGVVITDDRGFWGESILATGADLEGGAKDTSVRFDTMEEAKNYTEKKCLADIQSFFTE